MQVLRFVASYSTFFLGNTSRKTNTTMKDSPFKSIYLPLKMVIFRLAILVFRGKKTIEKMPTHNQPVPRHDNLCYGASTKLMICANARSSGSLDASVFLVNLGSRMLFPASLRWEVGDIIIQLAGKIPLIYHL